MGWRDCRVDRTLSIAAHHANVCLFGSTKIRPLANSSGLVDLYHLPHRFGLLVVIHSVLLSDSLKGAIVQVKCAKEIVRYLQNSFFPFRR